MKSSKKQRIFISFGVPSVIYLYLNRSFIQSTKRRCLTKEIFSYVAKAHVFKLTGSIKVQICVSNGN